MSKKYAISIVTPFHNVKMDIFKKGFESILNQDLGVDKIEWIVVVHNSEPHYEQEVTELLAPYDNFIVKILHNDKQTPSSPRNCGMDLATAKYIGFLDADDSFLPDCFSVALKHIKEEKPQITSFRREYELESEKSMRVTEITLWNQTREKIVLDRESWDEEKMFSGLCGLVTSRIYDRKFLVDNNIRFDEDILFAEDYLFNIEAYHYSKKVMYLPQLIGYHYFINGDSLVQSKSKDAQTLISYAEGYAHIFEKGLQYGMFMNNIMARLCFALARFMADNDNLTFDDRLQIKGILEKYIRMIRPLKKNKLYSEKKIKETYELPRNVIMNPRKWADKKLHEIFLNLPNAEYVEHNPMLNTLARILEKNADTDIGQQYGFSSIVTYQGYSSKVPIHNYDYYEPLIRLTTRIGESQIFTTENILFYSVSTDKSGRERLFPHEENEIETYTDAFADIVNGKNNLLLVESLPKLFHYNDQAYMNSVWGIALSYYFSHSDKNRRKAHFTSPTELLFPDKATMTEYVRVLFALLDPDVEQIVAPTTWGLVIAFYLMEARWENICDDIENGSLGRWCKIEDDLAASFQKRQSKNANRANELRAIFAEGFDTPVLPRIWPKLKRIVANKICGDAIYEAKLRRYAGDIERVQAYLISDEMVLGKEVGNSDTFELLPHNGFYEFKKGKKVYQADEVTIGEEYELLVTTLSGLYRYQTGRVVKIEKFKGDFPTYRLSYDVGNALVLPYSGNGSNVLSPDMVASAVVDVSKELQVVVDDFTYGDRNIENEKSLVELVIILEASMNPKLAQKLVDVGKDTISERLDFYLRRQSNAYASLKDSGELKLEVLFGEPETNYVFCSRRLVFDDLAQDRVIPAKYLANDFEIKFFTSKVIE